MHMSKSKQGRMQRAIAAVVFCAAGFLAPVFSRRVRYEVERSIWGVDEMPEDHRQWLTAARSRYRDIERRVQLLGPHCLSLGDRLWLRWHLYRVEAA